MKFKYLIICFLILISSKSIQAQDAKAVEYAATITADDLRRHLEYIASEEMMGRDTGSEGQKMAAKYIEDHFKEIGLEGPVSGSYFQVFNLASVSYPTVEFEVGRNKMKQFEDFVFIGDGDMRRRERADLVFVGDASDENLAKVNVSGKVAGLWGVGTNAQPLIRKLFDAGAVGVVFANSEDQSYFERLAQRYKSMSTGGRLGFEQETKAEPIYLVSANTFAEVFETPIEIIKEAAKNNPESIKPKKARYQVKKQKKLVSTENVLGYIEGTEKKEEVLVLSAHYDHVAPTADGRVIYGADDNGSGTVALMEIAEAFGIALKNGDRPRRSVLFIALTAEEKGLLGSQYYVENPIFPLENTVNNLNIDMLGRIDYDHQDQENPNYLYAIGSDMLSSHLKIILQYNNITYTNLDLDFKYDAPDDPNRFYYRSDHYNFAKYNIPSIFFFSGLHDDYHTPEDTVDKIEFPLMTTRARLIFHLAWDLATRENRTPVDGTNNR